MNLVGIFTLSISFVALLVLVQARTEDAQNVQIVSNEESLAFVSSVEEVEGTQDVENASQNHKHKGTNGGASTGRKKQTHSNSSPTVSTCGSGLVGDCVFAAKLKCGSPKKCCRAITFGVDTNDGATLNGAAEMHAAKVHFVVRYISQQATPPLPASEVAEWHANHFKVVAVFETSRLRPVEGGSAQANFANGVADAHTAIWQMNSYGAAKTRPVYFAVDAFVQPSAGLWKRLDPSLRIAKVADILPYFRGIRSVMNPKRVGAYGSYTTIKALFDRKLIKWGWQASSFDSGKRLDARSQLYQCSTKPPATFGSSQLDYDFALAADYGQF